MPTRWRGEAAKGLENVGASERGSRVSRERNEGMPPLVLCRQGNKGRRKKRRDRGGERERERVG
jgi:hypothetical protein